MIKLTNVTKIYKTGVRALNDVNLTTTIAIIHLHKPEDNFINVLSISNISISYLFYIDFIIVSFVLLSTKMNEN